MFCSLSSFICDLFIFLVGNKVHGRINQTGMKQLHRNLFSLQQNLTNIIQEAQEETFDRARQYVDLCMLTEEEIMVALDANKDVFSQKQWDLAISRARKL